MGRRLGLARKLRDDENAVAMLEYALLLALIALACIASFTALKNSLFTLIQQAITGIG